MLALQSFGLSKRLVLVRVDVLEPCLPRIFAALKLADFCRHVLNFAHLSTVDFEHPSFIICAISHDVGMGVQNHLTGFVYVAFIEVQIAAQYRVAG